MTKKLPWLGKKDAWIHIRCTQTERRLVQAEADALGFSVSAYLLRLHRAHLGQLPTIPKSR